MPIVNKTLSKLMLDIILTALFILLIYPRETGFSFHEIAGLASGAMVVIHLLLNWSWVKSVTKNLFNPKVKKKTKYFYILNMVSMIALVIIIITGIQISTVLFPGGEAASRSTLLLHKWLSYSALGLFGLHLALHWDFFTRSVPRVFKSPGRPSPGKLALNMGALVLILAFMFMQSGFNQDNYVLSSQPAQEIVSNNTAAIPPKQSSSTEDTLTASNVSYSPRGNGRKNSSPTAVAVPPTTSSSISSTTSTSSSISSSTSTSSSSSSQIAGSNTTSTTNQVSLTQYLGNLICTGCSKHCSLLAPQCSIGVSQAATAQQQYIAIYGSASLK